VQDCECIPLCAATAGVRDLASGGGRCACGSEVGERVQYMQLSVGPLPAPSHVRSPSPNSPGTPPIPPLGGDAAAMELSSSASNSIASPRSQSTVGDKPAMLRHTKIDRWLDRYSY
jgi:hypothetical protein